jgi:hypothetical protein
VLTICPHSTNLNGKLGPALDWQGNREKSVRGIADEFEKIRLGVVVHYIAASAKLGRDDLDDLTRKRRAFGKRPAVDENEVDGATQIEKRLPGVAGTSSAPITLPPPLSRMAAAK